jgi:hypothetical protein
MRKEELIQKINDECNNKTRCSINLDYDKIYTQEFMNKQDSATFAEKSHCGNEATFFLQYPCVIPKEFEA